MKKRILASFLSLVLVLSLVPASALAAEEPSEVSAEPTIVEPVEPSEVPAEPEETVCAELDGCAEDTHDPACPLYVEPEEPAEEPTEPENTPDTQSGVEDDSEPTDNDVDEANTPQSADGANLSQDADNAGSPVNEIKSATEITTAGGELGAGTYTLTGDVTLETANLSIPANTEVRIDLNGHTLTGNGSGSVITVQGTLTIKDTGSNGQITGCGSSASDQVRATQVNGGGIYIADGGKVTLEGGAITGNTAYNGGGVYVAKGTFIMTGGSISNNLSTRTNGGGGGGVYILDGGSFQMDNGKIAQNSSSSSGGGAVVYGTMIVNGGTISQNKALKGGGIFTGSPSVLTLNGGTITGNSLTEPQTGVGAGINIEAGCEFTVSGSPKVTENKIGEVDQNIYLDGGRCIALNGNLDNAAVLSVTLSGKTGKVTDARTYTFSDNSIISDDETLSIQIRNGDVYFMEKSVSEEDAVCSLLSDGKPVYFASLSGAVTALPSDDNVVTILRETVILDGQIDLLPNTSATITTNLNETVISWPDADTWYVNIPKTAELTVRGNVVFKGNHESNGENRATSNINAFRVAGKLNWGTPNGTSEYPKIQHFQNTAGGAGGPIHVNEGGTLNLYCGTISHNAASRGGAVYATGENAKLNLMGGTIQNNSAQYGGGAAVAGKASMELTGTVIKNNSATSQGGGICALDHSSIVMSGGTISGNKDGTATNQKLKGGGVGVMTGSSFTMTDGLIGGLSDGDKNSAADGGGICVTTTAGAHEPCTIELTGGAIKGNNAKNGGGVYVSGVDGKNPSASISGDVHISGNTAETYGGGVYLKFSAATISGGTIGGSGTNNIANSANEGGGVYSQNSSLVITGGTISGNKASTFGGGVRVFRSKAGIDVPDLKITDGTISNNSAVTGGGLHLKGNNASNIVVSEFLGGTVTENTATSNAGGIYIENCTTKMQGNPIITGNTSNGPTTNNIYLTNQTKITLTGALTSGAGIGVTMQNYAENVVVAEGTDDYTVTEHDAGFFTYDVSNGNLLIEKAKDQNSLILQKKDTNVTYYTVTLKLPEHVLADIADTHEVKKDDPYEVTFTVEEGYKIASVTVGGQEVALSEGNKITLEKVTADTEIKVTETAKDIHVTPEKIDVIGTCGTELTHQIDVSASYVAKNSIIRSYELAQDNVLPKGLTLSDTGLISGTPEEAGEWANGKEVSVVVTAQNGQTATITLNVKINKAIPTISITADKSSIVGGGTVELTVNVVPADSTVTVTQTDDQGSAAKTLTLTSGKVSVALDNKNAKYTFTASCAETDNYTAGSNTCTVTVSRRSSGGGSSSSSGDYIVSVDSDKHGTVTVSPKRADKGDTVTITVKPDKGYELDELTVTDKSGDTIKIKDKGNGKFTFTMPGSKVTVEASFKQIDTEPEVPAFADVPADAYYADAVAWAVKEGITSGTSAATFSPNASCTRAQMVTFLWRANGSPVVNYAMSFTDVPADAYYAEAVRWAVSEGITTGTTATTFSPNATLTRGQTVTFLWRANGSPAVSGSNFGDVASDAYYASAVAWAVSEGITSGTGDNNFSPEAPCTRAQIVTFMYRDAQ